MYGYEYRDKQQQILQEYLQQNKKINLNKYNIEVIREINGVFEIYTPTLRKFYLISKLLKHIDIGLCRQWINICVSLKNQKLLFGVCRSKLKTTGVTKKQRDAILYAINEFQKRLNWVQENILPEYIDLTPLKEYSESLTSTGQSLDDILIDYINSNNRPEDDFDSFDCIAEIIIEKTSNNTEYLKRLDEYKHRKNIIAQKIKAEERDKKLQTQLSNAYDRLSYLSNVVHKNIYNNIYLYSNFDFDKLHFYKLRGEKLAKIIIACKVSHKSAHGACYYIDKNNKLSESLSRSLVLAEHDMIPSEIQELVDEKKIVITEILFPV